MKECVVRYLSGKGFDVNTNAIEIIDICDDWYANRQIKDFHNRTNLNGENVILSQMNFAKRCCSDDANLCEIVDVSPEKESASKEFIDNLFKSNRFDVMYRKQLEKTAAQGTVGAYIYLDNAEYYERNGKITVKGGTIKINYVDGDCIIPLTIENELVTECAFTATNIRKGKQVTTLVIFTLNENGNYEAETVYFNETGSQIVEMNSNIVLGPVKPFGIMTNAEVNNIDNMEGYGLPKIYNNIPLFKAVDLCYNILYGDLDKGDKLLFINELLACIQEDEEGKPMLTPQQKKLFILLGEKLPDQDSIVKEYNPEIRIDSITKAFELVLSLISLGFGYGTKKYTFENGQITTATEYIGTKQDEMQELNKQRKNAEDYISDIIHAAMWFSNNFSGTSYNEEENLMIEFDDSYIEDRVAALDNMRTDALQFANVPYLTVMYLMERYNWSEEEAYEYMEDGQMMEDDEYEEESDEEETEEDDFDIDSLFAELENI